MVPATKVIERKNDKRMDELEAAMVANLPAVDCPVRHIFSKGMYMREIFMPAGSLITSKIHKTEHPYTISKGKVAVCIDSGEWVEHEAPYTGITRPGTRRLLYIIEDCTWTCYHRYNGIKGSENELDEVGQQKIVDKIEKRIIEKHINIALENIKNKKIWLGQQQQ